MCKYSAVSSSCGYGGNCEYDDSDECPRCRDYIQKEINLLKTFGNEIDSCFSKERSFFSWRKILRKLRNDGGLIPLDRAIIRDYYEEWLWEMRKRDEEDLLKF